MEWGAAPWRPHPSAGGPCVLEKKAANNAMELMTHWPNDWFPGWVETMTGWRGRSGASCAGGPHPQKARRAPRPRPQERVRQRAPATGPQRGDCGDRGPPADSALIELRSCERFGILSAASRRRGADDVLPLPFSLNWATTKSFSSSRERWDRPPPWITVGSTCWQRNLGSLERPPDRASIPDRGKAPHERSDFRSQELPGHPCRRTLLQGAAGRTPDCGS